ncbi:hypothetical protein GGX14DRAFT_573061 [Mycena pura]|uniref:Uncharacterized protein n=1 Tax=Mycena pura TaxID=153505 RepID=A0AAD6V0J6_9AGAR|nr:hypothetical protein GGX14DRAFT_573061 [Mycena pura]
MPRLRLRSSPPSRDGALILSRDGAPPFHATGPPPAFARRRPSPPCDGAPPRATALLPSARRRPSPPRDGAHLLPVSVHPCFSTTGHSSSATAHLSSSATAHLSFSAMAHSSFSMTVYSSFSAAALSSLIIFSFTLALRCCHFPPRSGASFPGRDTSPLSSLHHFLPSSLATISFSGRCARDIKLLSQQRHALLGATAYFLLSVQRRTTLPPLTSCFGTPSNSVGQHSPYAPGLCDGTHFIPHLGVHPIARSSHSFSSDIPYLRFPLLIRILCAHLSLS